MPIYEYQCEACAERIEIKQSMKDDPLTDCPRCGKRLQRLISSPAIMFKGSGWYVTDYSDKMKPSPGDEAPAPTTGEKKEAAPSTPEKTATATPTTPTSSSTATPAGTPPNTASNATPTAPTTSSPSTAK